MLSDGLVTSVFLLMTGFDLLVQDTVFWPGALLGELLDIPIVEILPLPIMTHKELEMSFPNPLAYAPQMGLAYTDQMVCTLYLLCIDSNSVLPLCRIVNSSVPIVSHSAVFKSCSVCSSDRLGLHQSYDASPSPPVHRLKLVDALHVASLSTALSLLSISVCHFHTPR